MVLVTKGLESIRSKDFALSETKKNQACCFIQLLLLNSKNIMIVLGTMKVMYVVITTALIKIIPQRGIKDSTKSSEIFNP